MTIGLRGAHDFASLVNGTVYRKRRAPCYIYVYNVYEGASRCKYENRDRRGQSERKSLREMARRLVGVYALCVR